jgi:hypothetical protein
LFQTTGAIHVASEPVGGRADGQRLAQGPRGGLPHPGASGRARGSRTPPFVQDDEKLIEFEKRVGLRREIGGPARQGVVDDGMRVRRRRDRRRRPLKEVLIDAERLVQLPQRLLESVRDGLAFRMVEALDVRTRQVKDETERARLGEERGVIDEPPQREQGVEAAGLVIVTQEATDAHYGYPHTGRCDASGLLASYRVRARPARSRMDRSCGSREVPHQATA